MAATPTDESDETLLSSVSSVLPATVCEKHDLVQPTAACTDCTHLLRFGTCGEPVRAGLLTAAEGYGIVWPPGGHSAACAAFETVR